MEYYDTLNKYRDLGYRGLGRDVPSEDDLVGHRGVTLETAQVRLSRFLIGIGPAVEALTGA